MERHGVVLARLNPFTSKCETGELPAASVRVPVESTAEALRPLAENALLGGRVIELEAGAWVCLGFAK